MYFGVRIRSCTAVGSYNLEVGEEITRVREPSLAASSEALVHGGKSELVGESEMLYMSSCQCGEARGRVCGSLHVREAAAPQVCSRYVVFSLTHTLGHV